MIVFILLNVLSIRMITSIEVLIELSSSIVSPKDNESPTLAYLTFQQVCKDAYNLFYLNAPQCFQTVEQKDLIHDQVILTHTSHYRCNPPDEGSHETDESRYVFRFLKHQLDTEISKDVKDFYRVYSILLDMKNKRHYTYAVKNEQIKNLRPMFNLITEFIQKHEKDFNYLEEISNEWRKTSKPTVEVKDPERFIYAMHRVKQYNTNRLIWKQYLSFAIKSIKLFDQIDPNRRPYKIDEFRQLEKTLQTFDRQLSTLNINAKEAQRYLVQYCDYINEASMAENSEREEMLRMLPDNYRAYRYQFPEELEKTIIIDSFSFIEELNLDLMNEFKQARSYYALRNMDNAAHSDKIKRTRDIYDILWYLYEYSKAFDLSTELLSFASPKTLGGWGEFQKLRKPRLNILVAISYIELYADLLELKENRMTLYENAPSLWELTLLLNLRQLKEKAINGDALITKEFARLQEEWNKMNELDLETCFIQRPLIHASILVEEKILESISYRKRDMYEAFTVLLTNLRQLKEKARNGAIITTELEKLQIQLKMMKESPEYSKFPLYKAVMLVEEIKAIEAKSDRKRKMNEEASSSWYSGLISKIFGKKRRIG